MDVPRITFLGICERGRFLQANEPYLAQHDILGLRKSIVTYIIHFLSQIGSVFFLFMIFRMESLVML